MPISPSATDPMRRPWIQVLAAILWPSFIVAGIANSLFFVFIDPVDLASIGGLSEDLDATAVYSLGFFALWLCTALSSAITQYFLRPLHRAPSRDKRG